MVYRAIKWLDLSMANCLLVITKWYWLYSNSIPTISIHFPQDPGSPPWQNLNPKRDSRCINSTMKNRLGSSLAWLRHVGSFESSGSPWADMGRTHGENSEFTKKKSCWMVVMIIITIMMMMMMMM
jgi:hypothetical protein